MAEAEPDYTVTPWVRVRNADGHMLDRHYTDPGIESGEFTVVKGYPPAHDPRPTVYQVTLKGAALDEALEEAGLPKGGSAQEKRERLAQHKLETEAGVAAGDNPTKE